MADKVNTPSDVYDYWIGDSKLPRTLYGGTKAMKAGDYSSREKLLLLK